MKFSLVTLGNQINEPRLLFFATHIEHLNDTRRTFTLSPEDIALLNPNTHTCPIFRSKTDAELTKKLYHRAGVFIEDAKRGTDGNPWGVTFRQGLFNMTSDSRLFRTFGELSNAGGKFYDMRCILPGGEVYLPLYEAKMVHHYDHRAGRLMKKTARTHATARSTKKRTRPFEPCRVTGFRKPR